MTLKPDPETGTSCEEARGCDESVYTSELTCIDGRLLGAGDGRGDWTDMGPCECWCHSDDRYKEAS